MPILEFVCKDCAHPFEAIVLNSKTPECPACRGTQLEKKLSVFAVGAQRERVAAAQPVGGCGNCTVPGGPEACPMNPY